MARIPNLITGVTARLPGDLRIHPDTVERSPIRASTWTIRIPGWMPTPLNRLLGQHWGNAHRAKKADKETIGLALMVHAVPTAECKRRLRVLVVLPKGKRAPDPDAFDKTLRDALVYHGALKNDSHLWVEGVEPQFARGDELVTFITLEDVR